MPVYNAIVWQDHRTADFCKNLVEKGFAELIKRKTGLETDAYFSASKINWILNNVEGVRRKAEKGELAFGTVDSWLIWNLTQGEYHQTDISNASRTMLFNIHELKWDDELLDLFDIPASLLPEVFDNDQINLRTSGKIFQKKIAITGVGGDQQAALFGQMCLDEGMLKNTYGTGCFLMMNTGSQAIISNNRLITTIAWRMKNETVYALEGSVFVAGAAIQWLRDGLQLIKKSNDINQLALTVENNGGVYFVPAFTGLGAPYWQQQAKGIIYGITRGTNAGHFARAALESIAFQSNDVISAMREDTGKPIRSLRVDGGASVNDLLLQFQANISQIELIRPKIMESTALGAAYFAGLNVGFWEEINSIKKQWTCDAKFLPDEGPQYAEKQISNWRQVVARSF